MRSTGWVIKPCHVKVQHKTVRLPEFHEWVLVSSDMSMHSRVMTDGDVTYLDTVAATVALGIMLDEARYVYVFRNSYSGIDVDGLYLYERQLLVRINTTGDTYCVVHDAAGGTHHE